MKFQILIYVIEKILLFAFLYALGKGALWVLSAYGQTAFLLTCASGVVVALGIALHLDRRHPRRPRS